MARTKAYKSIRRELRAQRAHRVQSRMTTNLTLLSSLAEYDTDHEPEIAIRSEYSLLTNCILAVSIDPFAIQNVPNHFKTPELCMLAVTKNPHVLRVIPNLLHSDTLLSFAMSKSGLALKYVEPSKRSRDLCMIALTQTPRALAFFPPSIDFLSHIAGLLDHYEEGNEGCVINLALVGPFKPQLMDQLYDHYDMPNPYESFKVALKKGELATVEWIVQKLTANNQLDAIPDSVKLATLLNVIEDIDKTDWLILRGFLKPIDLLNIAERPVDLPPPSPVWIAYIQRLNM